MHRAILLLLAAAAHAAPLFDGGRWYGPVVLPASPADDEWLAARSLQEQCERVTGVRPELVTEGQGPAPAVGLFVGRTAAFAATGVSLPDPEGDLLMTATRDDRVFILGDSPAATRMAVGRFAERTLGVTFLFPGPDGFDAKPLTRVVQPDGEVFRPAFAWRALGGLRTEGDEEWAFNVGYGRAPDFSHGFFRAFGPRGPDAVRPGRRLAHAARRDRNRSQPEPRPPARRGDRGAIRPRLVPSPPGRVLRAARSQ
jgi:hypothetical protein